MPLQPLSTTEARVLATLMEKARTVPDSYPLSLIGVVAGCNQKSSRDPVMQVSETDAQAALDALRQRTLAFDSSGSRTTRWEHNAERGLGVPGAAAALLGLLVLRGPQTPAELRIHAERWHRFADTSSVEAFLDELASRPDERGGPLVVQLPRQPGAREARWMHLLCGPVDVSAAMANAAPSSESSGPSDGALAARVTALEEALQALRADFEAIRPRPEMNGGG